MSRTVSSVAVLLFAVGACAEERPAKPPTDFTVLPALAEAIAKADKVVLFEGLPHQLFEGGLLAAELKKKTVRFADYPFYAETLDLKDGDAKKLIATAGTKDTYRAFGGEKKCGGYHPDYAIEFHVGQAKYYALICFGCHETIVIGPKTTVRTDMSDAGHKGFEALLKGDRKNRPAKKE